MPRRTLGSLWLSLVAVGCEPVGKEAGAGGLADSVVDTAIDADGDGVPADIDCDDTNPSIHPDAAEACNGVDDDCDGEVDEGTRITVYVDADGDGFGGLEGSEVCSMPEGTSTNNADCDDDNADIHPDAAELCNGIDDNCDRETDEGVLLRRYRDLDGDGFGDPDAPVDTCDPAPNEVENDADCNDGDRDIHPEATEVCNEIDDNCDDVVDEGVTNTYFQDLDLDGWGGFGGTTEACAEPPGYATFAGDCEDSNPAIHPEAAEVCNTIDDDCDGLLDDLDPDVVVSTGSVFYVDVDRDGHGDAATSLLACVAPVGFVSDATDCNDGNAAISPSAIEVCNNIDDDCDLYIDGADLSIDQSTMSWYYDDDDHDGYGDAAAATLACNAPPDSVADATDCDDLDATVNPAASEVCNTIDDDCDGDIDDDDSSLDLSTAEEWWADVDSDGEGDPAVSVLTCDAPSGYVDNSLDCDDTDATDTDGDAVQDCADDDIDGDGIRNDWDADPYDPTVARPPTGGLGTDGPRVVSGAEVMSDWTRLSSGVARGGVSLSVDDASIVSVGDEVLVLSQQGTDAGQYQFVFVAGVSGNTLTIEPPLDAAYSGSSDVLVQRVPHYTTVDVPVGASLVAEPWSGAGGGVVVFRATDAVTIAGTLSAAGAGFSGGAGVYGNGSNPAQGESYAGVGAFGVTSANGGGGGAYPGRGDNGDSGGGGGYGGAGDSGTNYNGSAVTSGGAAYGDAALSAWFLGSGGGGGSPDTEGDGVSTGNYAAAGGAGGGLVAVFSAVTISVTGALTVDGDDADVARSADGEVGGGGGGAGGMLLLAAPTLSLSGSVTAEGGAGSISAWHSPGIYGSARGGDGGDGRVRLESTTTSGSTAPAAGSTATFVP